MPASFSYTLSIGGEPAASGLLGAIQQIEVEDHAAMASMLRLRVSIDVRTDGTGFALLDDDPFPRLTPVRLDVHIGPRRSETLIDARVIDNEVEISNQPGASVLTVAAMDPSVEMSLEERVRPWPDMADSDIAAELFQEYGFEADVEPTRLTHQTQDVTTIQRGTDIQLLRRLAARNGYLCYVEADPETGVLNGHFHPPRLDGPPQQPLAIHLGGATNLTRFRARNDLLRPARATVAALAADTLTADDPSADELSLTALGAHATLNGRGSRHVFVPAQGLSGGGALQRLAQAAADRTGWAVTAEGALDGPTYGAVLRAKRTVDVRGAGRRFSGRYFVERVLHTFTQDGYTQQFTLRRNALGLTGDERFTEDDALPS